MFISPLDLSLSFLIDFLGLFFWPIEFYFELLNCKLELLKFSILQNRLFFSSFGLFLKFYYLFPEIIIASNLRIQVFFY